MGRIIIKSQLIPLLRFREGLKPNGFIIVKENTTSTGENEVDDVDSSLTRPVAAFRQLFTNAGLECYRVVKQNNFPRGIYAVHMFALKPKLSIKNENEPVNLCLENLNIADTNK